MGETAGQRGTRYERELVNALRQSSYGALRFPASGSATTRSVPDILAAQPVNDLTSLWGIELKSGKSTTLYVEGAEVSKLRAFTGRWGAQTFLAARFTTQATDRSHWLVEPDNARETEGGNYGLPIEDIEQRATYRVIPASKNERATVVEL